LSVPADSPFNSFEEVYRILQSKSRQFNYGSPGTGTFAQVAAAAVIAKAGIEMTHVPFDGSANTHTAVLGKHVDGAAYLATDCKQYVDSGDFKVLWTTAKTDMYPDAPTTADIGIDYDLVAWTGLVGPAGMDEAVVQIITDAYKKALEDPATVELFASMGYTGNYQDPAAYKQILLG
jgi:tripartite-type tricarboxylate transporter receptor subunit TctC